MIASAMVAVSDLGFPAWLPTGINDGTVAFAAAVIAFVFQYTFTSPWWKDQVGITIVIKDACLLGILVPASINYVWPGTISATTMLWLDLIVVWTATASMIWRCVVWFHIRRPWPFHRDPGESDEEPE